MNTSTVLRGFLACAKGQDHSKDRLLPAVWSEWEWSGITETMERTECFYSQIIPELQLQCIFYSLWLTGSQLFLCQVHLLAPSSFLSAFRAWSEPPTKPKQRADRGFFFTRLKDYIIWLSVCCVHICTHTNLVADGRRRHTCTYHTLTVSFLLTQTRFDSVQTAGAHRRTHAHTLWGHHPHFSRQAGPAVPRGRDCKTEKEISGRSDVYVIYTPTPSSLVVFIFLSPPFPSLQVQQSVEIHSLPFEINTNILSILICLTFHVTRGPCWPAHGSQLYCQGHKVFFFFFLSWARNHGAL